jgi:hypothetical protein
MLGRAVFAVIWAFLLPLGSCSHSPTPDSWEVSSAPLSQGIQCYGVETDLVIPVTHARRPQAVSLLESSQVVGLDGAEAAWFTGANAQTLTASKLAIDALAVLNNERERVLSTRQGSWSGVQESRTVALERLIASPRMATLQPFLVRGIAKNEGTGAFYASWCGDDLMISHLSLGAEPPPSTRLPVVVFLDRAPINVRVTWAMAK